MKISKKNIISVNDNSYNLLVRIVYIRDSIWRAYNKFNFDKYDKNQIRLIDAFVIIIEAIQVKFTEFIYTKVFGQFYLLKVKEKYSTYNLKN